MNIFIYVFFAFWAFCVSCFSCSTGGYQISDREKAVNKQMVYSGKVLSEKYHMQLCSTAVAMPGGDIRYLELEFEVQGPLSKENIRGLLIQMARDFSKNINKDSQLCSYLKRGRMDISEIGIGLFLVGPSRRALQDPEISIASIRKGELKYFQCDPNDISIHGMHGTHESYEEALKIFADQRDAI